MQSAIAAQRRACRKASRALCRSCATWCFSAVVLAVLAVVVALTVGELFGQLASWRWSIRATAVVYLGMCVFLVLGFLVVLLAEAAGLLGADAMEGHVVAFGWVDCCLETA